MHRSGVRGDPAGLARAAHFAGQAFGHEDVVALPTRRFVVPSSSRALGWLMAAAALIGLAVLALDKGFAAASY